MAVIDHNWDIAIVGSSVELSDAGNDIMHVFPLNSLMLSKLDSNTIRLKIISDNTLFDIDYTDVITPASADIDDLIDILETIINEVGAGGGGGGDASAANQVTGNTSLSNINTNIGAKADTSATTDAGTFSLIALFKRLLEKISAGLSTGGYTEKISAAVTTSATAYTANDNIGGIQTLTNILRTSGGTGVLQELSFWAIANQKPNLYIDFYDASPAGTYTNDAGEVIAGDHTAWLGFIEIGASDWKDTGTISRVTKTGLGLILKGNASRNIFMTIQDKTGVTFGTTAGLFYKVAALQD